MRNEIGVVLLATLLLAAGCDNRGIHSSSPQPLNEVEAPETTARVLVDPTRERVWMITNADGVVVVSAQSSKRTIVALPGWIWVEDPRSCMPDMALGPRGEVVVTSNVTPIVWRIDPDTLDVSEHRLALNADGGKDVGFTGLVYSPDRQAYFAVSGAHGTLWRINTQLTRGEKLALSLPIPDTCRVEINPYALQANPQMTTGLVVSGAETSWVVDVVRGQPSAFVRKVACTDLPSQFRQLALNCAD